MDSQSARTTSVGGIRGYDGGKKLSGRKRHLLVDTLGLVLRATVHAADMQDRAAVPQVLQGVTDQFGRLAHIWLDQGYTGAGRAWIERELGWSVEIVKHAPRPRGMWVFPGQDVDPIIFQRPKGFRHLPRRWVVERTFSWFGQARRLSKDYERLPETEEAMIYATMSPAHASPPRAGCMTLFRQFLVPQSSCVRRVRRCAHRPGQSANEAPRSLALEGRSMCLR